MSIDVTKKAAEISLVKQMQTSMDQGNDPGEIAVQAEMYIDSSTSMSQRYKSGKRSAPSEMQTTITRNLALILTGLDEDQVLPLAAFDKEVHGIGPVDEQNYEQILTGWLKSNSLYPATQFMPIVRQVLVGYDPETAKDEPVRVVFLHTDGQPSDHAQFRQALIEHSDKPIFWIIMGHGQSLNFVRELDNMKDDQGNDPRVVDNVALIEVDDASKLTDTEYFDKVTNELITKWFPAIRVKQLTHR